MSNSLKAIGTLASLKGLTSILGLLYSVLLINYFGTSRTIEVFFAAQSIVYLITSLTQSGQLAEVFLPVYLKLKNENSPSIGHKAYSVVVNRLGLYILPLLLMAYGVANFLMQFYIPGFEIAEQEKASLLFRAFLPLIFLQIQSSFMLTVLNAEQIYGKAEIAGIVSLLISIVLIVFFNKTIGIWILLIALYIAKIVEISMYLYYAMKANIKYYAILNSSSFDHTSFFKTMFSTLSYTSATQVFNWSMTASISFLPQGTYALFQYAQKLFSKVSNLVVQPISIVFFTKISDLIAKKKLDACRSIVDKAQIFGLLLSTTTFLFAFLIGEELLSLIWTGSDVTNKEITQAYYFLIVFFSLFLLQSWFTLNRKITMAIGSAMLFYKLASLAMLISAASAFFLIRTLGVNGLYVSIIISKIMFFIAPAVIIYNKEKMLFFRPKLSFLFRNGLIIVLIVLLVLFTKNYIGINNDVDLTKLSNFIGVASVALLIAFLYVFLLFAFFKTPFIYCFNQIKNKLYA